MAVRTRRHIEIHNGAAYHVRQDPLLVHRVIVSTRRVPRGVWQHQGLSVTEARRLARALYVAAKAAAEVTP